MLVYQRVLFWGKPCSYSLEMIEGNGKLAGKCLIILISIYLGGKKKENLATMIYDGNLRHTICGAVAPPKSLETRRVHDG